MAYYIFSGVISTGITLDENNMYISSGGAANSTTVSHVHLRVRYCNDTTVSSGGNIYVSGGNAVRTEIVSQGKLFVSGGTITSAVISGTVSAAAAVMNNTFLGTGSLLTASSGTVLNHIQVDDYGLLELEAYAKLCGEMLFAENALFTVDSRSTLDFTISGRNTSAGYLVNDLSVISGIPDYTLTVSADQSAGTYKLAQNAAAFSESITIRSGSTTLGDVTIDTDLTLNNKVYDLNLADGNLTLTIKVIVPPEELPGVPPGVHVPATDIKNRGFSQVLAWDKNRGAVGMINNNGNFPAAWIGNLDKSFAVESVGDYNADGKEDILLREQNSGWGGLGFWGAGYAGNWVDMNARIETDTRISGSKFDIIA